MHVRAVARRISVDAHNAPNWPDTLQEKIAAMIFLSFKFFSKLNTISYCYKHTITTVTIRYPYVLRLWWKYFLEYLQCFSSAK